MHAFFKRLSWDRIAAYTIWGFVSIGLWEATNWLSYRLLGLWCGG